MAVLIASRCVRSPCPATCPGPGSEKKTRPSPFQAITCAPRRSPRLAREKREPPAPVHAPRPGADCAVRVVAASRPRSGHRHAEDRITCSRSVCAAVDDRSCSRDEPLSGRRRDEGIGVKVVSKNGAPLRRRRRHEAAASRRARAPRVGQPPRKARGSSRAPPRHPAAPRRSCHSAPTRRLLRSVGGIAGRREHARASGPSFALRAINRAGEPFACGLYIEILLALGSPSFTCGGPGREEENAYSEHARH